VDALVLDLDARAGLAIARSLARSGYVLGVAAYDPDASGLRTRHAAERLLLPSPQDDFDAYADAIAAWARRHPDAAIVPSVDASVAALHRRRAELAHAALGAPEAVEIAISKPRTLALAAELGIVAPRSLAAGTPGEVEAAARELGLPVVVKPVESWRDEAGGGERLGPELALSDDDLGRVRRLAPALVQELAPGDRETIKLFRANGETIARFAMRIDRTWPPLGGSSVFRQSIPLPPDALERAERLVDAIGLEGYSEVEFRRGRDGTPLLMEVNPRLSQSVELAVRAGIDFPRLQVDWARGREVSPVPGYRTGVRLGWLAGDGRVLAASLVGSGPPPRPPRPSLLRDYVLGRARVEGFDLGDPGPMLGALAFTGRALSSRGTRRRGESPG
jgi:predicted ATP-grasp superfamily ATP-dependent carboligase